MNTSFACEIRSAVGEVNVVYTTAQNTRVALEAATVFSGDLKIDIRVLFLQIVPYPLPIDEPTITTSAIVNRILLELRSDCQPGFMLQYCFCRDYDEALVRILKPHSVVVMGKPAGAFALRERRIARTLRRLGHQVLFVPAKKH